MDAEVHERLRPDRDVVIVEVGPRDGLQNESGIVPTEVKIDFIHALAAAGLPVIEATSFVNPRRVPQLADASEVMTGIHRTHGVRYPVLVPNERGLERAIAAGVDAIALFAAATEAFSVANIGASIADSFARFQPVAAEAKRRKFWMRGYVSVAFGCPFSGSVAPRDVAAVVERLLALGCDEICLADTIGAASPASTQNMLQSVMPGIPAQKLALHFHDTAGNALANVEEALSQGIRIFDSAAGGLGGCPFAPGAPGNLATGQLVNRLEQFGLRSGVSTARLQEAMGMLSRQLSRPQLAGP